MCMTPRLMHITSYAYIIVYVFKYIYIHMYTTKGCLCCSIADQKGFQNPALRRKATSMEQINPRIRVS